MKLNQAATSSTRRPTIDRSLPKSLRFVAAAVATGAVLAALSGCAPLLIGGAVLGGSLVAIDRRTSGTQVEDQAIELKAGSRVRELATLGHVNVTSYNRTLLLSGEVPGEAEKRQVGEAVAGIENLRHVVNEVEVTSNSSVTTRSNDALLSARVKASFVDAKDLQVNALKVTTERGIVYLMGIVSEREAARAAEVASSVSGVQKVVKVFEVVSDDDIRRMTNR